MPRSQYIYLVRRRKNDDLLGGFTVKHEAHTAVGKSGWGRDDVKLSRIKDGRLSDESGLEWEWELDRSRPRTRGSNESAP